MAEKTSAPSGAPMDSHGERKIVPAADRLHGADRGSLGEEGWAEVPDDLVGDPGDTNVAPEFYQPRAPQR